MYTGIYLEVRWVYLPQPVLNLAGGGDQCPHAQANVTQQKAEPLVCRYLPGLLWTSLVDCSRSSLDSSGIHLCSLKVVTIMCVEVRPSSLELYCCSGQLPHMHMYMVFQSLLYALCIVHREVT